MGLKLMETEKDYFIFASPTEFAEKMKQIGYENTICIDGVELTDSDIRVLQKLNKGIMLLTYEPEKTENPEYDALVKRLKDADLRLRFYNLGDSNHEYDSMDAAVESFKDVASFEESLNMKGITRNWDYSGRCGNCHNELESDDKYCRVCGTKAGQGKFEPYFNTIGFYYGSPIVYNYICPDCGTEWQYTGYEEGRYCPNCGKRAETYKEPLSYLWDEMFGEEKS